MVHGARPVRLERNPDTGIPSLEQLVVFSGALASLLVPLRQMLKFYVKEARLNGVQSSVIAFHVVVVLLSLAMIANHADPGAKSIVVRRDRPRFAAGTQVLAGIEAESGGPAHRAGDEPAVVFAREVLCAMRLASIFHHNETEAV